jgi:hypothetical protein
MEKSELLKIQDACRSGAIHFLKNPPFMEEKLWDIRCSPKHPPLHVGKKYGYIIKHNKVPSNYMEKIKVLNGYLQVYKHECT